VLPDDPKPDEERMSRPRVSVIEKEPLQLDGKGLNVTILPLESSMKLGVVE
jgi:hypothetical protein